ACPVSTRQSRVPGAGVNLAADPCLSSLPPCTRPQAFRVPERGVIPAGESCRGGRFQGGRGRSLVHHRAHRASRVGDGAPPRETDPVRLLTPRATASNVKSLPGTYDCGISPPPTGLPPCALCALW